MDAWDPAWRNQIEGHTVECVADIGADPLRKPIRRSRDLDGVERDIARESRWPHRIVGLPFKEVRQLRISQEPTDSDLDPLEPAAIRELAGAGHCGTLEALLVGGNVGDADYPAEPTATHIGAGANGLSECGLVSGRVVEDLNYLDVAGISQRDDVIAGTETWMEPAILVVGAERIGQPGRLSFEAARADCIHQMVDVHEVILAPGMATREIGPGGCRGRRGCDSLAGRVVRVTSSKILLSTTSVYPEASTSAFELAADLGFDGVELMVGVDSLSTDIGSVAKLADYHGVPVLSVHAPTLLVTQTTWGSDSWEKLRRSGEAVQQLGGDVVVVHPPFRWQREYGAGFVAGIKALNATSKVKYAVENMYPWRTPGKHFQAYLPSWDPTPYDYDHLTLDLSHASTAQRQSMDFVHAWGTRLAHVHLTDGTGSFKDEHLMPGEGDQAAWEVVEYLARTGYEGHIVLEVSSRRAKSRREREELLGDSLTAIRKAVAAGVAAR